LLLPIGTVSVTFFTLVPAFVWRWRLMLWIRDGLFVFMADLRRELRALGSPSLHVAYNQKCRASQRGCSQIVRASASLSTRTSGFSSS
jgi:hypothetical protein